MDFKKILFASALSLLLNAPNTEPQCEPEGPIPYIVTIDQALNSFEVEKDEEKPRLDLLRKVIQLDFEQYNKLDIGKLTRDGTYSEYSDPENTEVVYAKEMNTFHTFYGFYTDPGLQHCIYNAKDGSISIPMHIIFLHGLFTMSDVMRFIAKENTARLLLKTIYSDEGLRYIEDLIQSGLPNRTIFKILDIIRRCDLMIPFETNEEYVEGDRGCITGATKNEEYENKLNTYIKKAYSECEFHRCIVKVELCADALSKSNTKTTKFKQELHHSKNTFERTDPATCDRAFLMGFFNDLDDYHLTLDEISNAFGIECDMKGRNRTINFAKYLNSFFSFKYAKRHQNTAVYLDWHCRDPFHNTDENLLLGPKHAFRYAKKIEPKYKDIGVQTSIENINTEIHTSMTSAVKSRALSLLATFGDYASKRFMNWYINMMTRHRLDFYRFL
jgi:hypothetical protein